MGRAASVPSFHQGDAFPAGVRCNPIKKIPTAVNGRHKPCACFGPRCNQELKVYYGAHKTTSKQGVFPPQEKEWKTSTRVLPPCVRHPTFSPAGDIRSKRDGGRICARSQGDGQTAVGTALSAPDQTAFSHISFFFSTTRTLPGLHAQSGISYVPHNNIPRRLSCPLLTGATIRKPTQQKITT